MLEQRTREEEARPAETHLAGRSQCVLRLGHLSKKASPSAPSFVLPVQPCFLCFSSSLLASPAATFKEGCPSAAPRTESCAIGAVAVGYYGPHDSELPICSEAVEKIIACFPLSGLVP